MGCESRRSLVFIYETWREEDRQLEGFVDDVRDWMQEVNQLGIPHFGETALRFW